MSELETYQYLLIALIFVWSGFVRSGLGFGGAALSLPFLLLIENQPLIFLPIIAIHLLVFSSSTVLVHARRSSLAKASGGAFRQGIDWAYLRYALAVMIIPKLLGVFGLITLPPAVMSGIIFSIVAVYAIGYILNRPFKSNSKAVDALFLMLGGYISGSSLIGAPLIIAVFANHVDKHQLRDTLFVLWFILVTIKMAAFIAVGIDLQLIHQLWLLPCATVGHLLGLRLHRRMLDRESPLFFRLLGSALLLISTIGLLKGLV
ncbi:sulfite exporter TauE/SafE family protein [Sedimenticola selenatireducens]|uniref:Probable membrane transporter protein n=1 Tax=Sedimenticola selenatireducens TaxID=191960 RepID=A0A2N6D0Z7_9GAMM|nr:sulfite exporter TauE/SafE family protein [Sedimenticola selenatireducens]PLX63358.1 MAG: permease [Sedimenticola selenatireducens]